MTFRGFLSLITLVVFLFATSTRDLGAAGAVQQSRAGAHAVSPGELHQTIQASREQTNQARKSVQDLLARPDVRNLIQRMGMRPNQVVAQVAMLNDAEILWLHQQTMNMELQKETAGLSKGAIWAIVLVAIVATILINWALWPD